MTASASCFLLMGWVIQKLLTHLDSNAAERETASRPPYRTAAPEGLVLRTLLPNNVHFDHAEPMAGRAAHEIRSCLTFTN